MPDSSYVVTALAIAVSITVALRAAPFIARSGVKDSPLLADLGRWMPLGAVTILAVYCLSLIDVAGPGHGAGPLAGVAVTAGVHLWRRNVVLSIVAGTAVCLVVTNWL